jgi:predicted TPR repeat methyltransferase
VLKTQGKLEEALEAFQRAGALKPDYADAFHNMGSTLIQMDRPDHALVALKKAADLDPGNHSAKYIVSALSGENPASAPPEYIKELFDQYSKRFDEHLTKKLDYKTPQILRDLIEAVEGKKGSFGKILDLGCGAGLSGEAFRDAADCLDGVDISGDMIQAAREKNIYDRLETSEIESFLDHCRGKYDLAVAADVFVYIGDLDPVFSRIKKVIKTGGYFLFSTEKYSGEGYRLGPSGRFAHNEEYIRSVGQSNDFECVHSEHAVLRKEGGKDVLGDCFVLERK